MEVMFLILLSLVLSGLLFSAIAVSAYNVRFRTCIFIGLQAGLISGVISDAIYYFLFTEAIPVFFLGLVLVAGLGLLLVQWKFYRDPERVAPNRTNVVISPADGRVIYIRKSNKGIIPHIIEDLDNIHISEVTKTDAVDFNGYLIGINMTLLDVHVNRSPIDGKVTLNKHTKGAFFSLGKRESKLNNERNTIVIEGDSMRVAVMQIAGRRVRRIISYVNEGQFVKKGERIGKIVRGSQVDILIPFVEGLRITVKEHDYVYAGTSILAEY